ncbi:ATP-binding response regulator [Methylobacterium sp. ID0610]|uniref:ATP-binding response regulator n=1 Tax=Methylobacterium carpenticola TaxID=3344827 RepID=UPI0036A7F9FE
MSDDDILILAPDDEAAPGEAASVTWPVVVVDDDPAVHEGTRFALAGYALDGARLDILSAHSAAEARALLADRAGEVAVILLDVVMETEDAGLRLVDYIRRELRDETVRIILRTGQPGQAPERRVIVDYDINDYKAKTELTADKLFTSLTAALRAYQQLKRLEETRRGLEIIIDAAPMLLDYQSMQRLAEGVLTQVASLLNVACEGILVLREKAGLDESLCVLAGSGCYQHLVAPGTAGPPGAALPLDEDVRTIVGRAFAERRHMFGDRWSTLYVHTASGSEIVALLKADRSLSETDRALIALFTSRLSIAFDNVILYEQLQRANVGLEQRVVERTAELMRANRRLALQRSDLRRANQLKTEILGTVAHDLKNPLAVILGRAEMLGDMIGTLPQPVEAMRAQVGSIRDSARRLTAMIESLIADAMNDALDITLRREPVDFAALAREVSGANAPLAETKAQRLVSAIPESLFICGDGERLREAMDNLISNAIKYSPAGAEIVVTVGREGEDVIYAVRDFGPGLSPEDTARLFGRFQRLSAKPTGGEGSTGLGLSIVKRIAELHGGRAIAESHAPEPGSTFAIRLPVIAVELA